jgi:hypothetical protein
MTILTKMASLLEALAEEADTRPPTHATPDPFLSRLEARVGAPLPEEMRAKLGGDEELRKLLTPILDTPDAPRPLGEPSEKSAAPTLTPMTKAERRKAAEDEFAERVLRSARG